MTPRALSAAVLLGFAAATAAAVGQTAIRAGGELQVNTYTLFEQWRPAVAMQPDGGFGIAWESDGSIGTDWDLESIQARRFGGDGSPRGGEGQVNTYVASSQNLAAVGADAQGRFVVVWTSDGSDGSDSSNTSIQAQRFAADGTPISTQFQVNSYTTGFQANAAVAVGPTGAFVVVWEKDSLGSAVRGQLFAADGSMVGSEFQVSTLTRRQQYPSVAMSAAGRFVVVWASDHSIGSDHDYSSIQGRLYDASGLPEDLPAQVNSYVTGIQWSPAVAMNAEGAFVVVWESGESPDNDHDGWSIQGRLFASNGAPLAPQAQVNTYVTGSQFRPAVAANADGDFVVAWESQGSAGSDQDGFSIQGRLYAPNGAPIGLQAQVNSFTSSDQRRPAVAIDPRGDFVVVWDSDGSSGGDTEGTSIQAQRYVRPIFIDGFEGGDMTAWSSAVP